MNVCPTSGPVAPPPEMLPFMLASLAIPLVFIAGFVAIVAFLAWKLAQSHERHQGTLHELSAARLRVAELESRLTGSE